MIKFSRTDKIYGCFSNFYPCTVKYEGITYPNSECAWQSLKTFDIEKRKSFSTYTAAGAKKMGRRLKLRFDWEEVKYDLMVDVCHAKFSQNEDLKKILLSTKNELIIENTTAWHDNTWGNCECVRCKNTEGRNLLGKALMEVRKRLFEEEKEKELSSHDRLCNLLKNVLLLVIDMQNVYLPGEKWECKNFNNALDSIKTIINKNICEKVIFTRFLANENPQGIWKDYNVENFDVNSDEWANELVDDLKDIIENYECYDKSVYSSYSIDEVKNEANKASCVVVTGVVAECCVLSTVMSLIDAGIYVVYLKDAVAGIDEETENATIKILEGLDSLHLKIMTVDEFYSLKSKI